MFKVHVNCITCQYYTDVHFISNCNIACYDFVQDARDKDDYNESHIITAKRALKVHMIELFIYVMLILL